MEQRKRSASVHYNLGVFLKTNDSLAITGHSKWDTKSPWCLCKCPPSLSGVHVQIAHPLTPDQSQRLYYADFYKHRPWIRGDVYIHQRGLNAFARVTSHKRLIFSHAVFSLKYKSTLRNYSSSGKHASILCNSDTTQALDLFIPSASSWELHIQEKHCGERRIIKNIC